MHILRLRTRSVCIILFGSILLSVYLWKRSQTATYYEELALPLEGPLEGGPSIHVVKREHPSSIGGGGSQGPGDSKTSDKSKSSGVAGLSASGCVMPELKAHDPELQKFFQHVPPLKCAEESNWIYTGNGTLHFDPAATRRHGPIICHYTNFWRVSDHRTSKMLYLNISDGATLEGDFFQVKCKGEDRAVYDNVHAAIKPIPDAIERARNITPAPNSLGMNVYMLGFDSISRLTFMRKMPKTLKYLKEQLGAVVLEQYNVVGDGTPQALIPILTGQTEVELPLTRKRFKNSNYVNVYPFVWNDYRDAGYVTLYGEDAASIGTFTYRLKGFDKQPTDHYMRTFYTIAEGEAKKHPPLCWGSERHHVVHFRYVEKFFDAYPALPKFAFQFHSVLSHDNINNIEQADDDMVAHLEFFRRRNHANNTMFVFMSDHGHRFASLRETQQGKLEERLPLMTIAMPSWFQEKYQTAMKNLRQNAHRLTSPFDLYPTFKAVLNFHEPKVGSLKQRSISLFDDIPEERGCSDAGIEPHWCACMAWEDVSVQSPLITYMAKSLVATINSETAHERKLCAPLRLLRVDKALKYAPNRNMMHYKKAKDYDGFEPDLSDNTTTIAMEYYQLNFWTIPGNAHYEASVTHNKKEDALIIDLDVVSHINAFGDLPKCIIDKDYFIIKWCVCYDRIKTGSS